MRVQVGNSEFINLNLHRLATVINEVLKDYHLQERVLNDYDIDTVLHLGEQTQVTIANRNPLSTFESNIIGTRCLMEATHRNTQVERIVVASSNKPTLAQINYPTLRKPRWKEPCLMIYPKLAPSASTWATRWPTP